MKEIKERETRQEVKDLCYLLGGELLEDYVDRFRLKGFDIDLSMINNESLGVVTIIQLEEKARSYGKHEKMTEIRAALDI